MQSYTQTHSYIAYIMCILCAEICVLLMLLLPIRREDDVKCALHGVAVREVV